MSVRLRAPQGPLGAIEQIANDWAELGISIQGITVARPDFEKILLEMAHMSLRPGCQARIQDAEWVDLATRAGPVRIEPAPTGGLRW